jgi:hypothetical protein
VLQARLMAFYQRELGLASEAPRNSGYLPDSAGADTKSGNPGAALQAHRRSLRPVVLSTLAINFPHIGMHMKRSLSAAMLAEPSKLGARD